MQLLWIRTLRKFFINDFQNYFLGLFLDAICFAMFENHFLLFYSSFDRILMTEIEMHLYLLLTCLVTYNSYILLYYIELYSVTFLCITLYYIRYYVIMYHVIMYNVIIYHVIMYHVIMYNVIMYHVIMYHVIMYHIIMYHVIIKFLRFRLGLTGNWRDCAICWQRKRKRKGV